MRQLCVLSAFLISVSLAACGGDGNPAGDDVTDPDAGLPPPGDGFQIVTTPLTVTSGQEITKCFYTTIDIDAAAGVSRWVSQMTDGCHHMIVYFTDAALAADGVTDNCDAANAGGGGLSIPTWTYAAQTQDAEMAMPAGVGMEVKAQQHLYIQTHYLNATPGDLEVHVTLNGETYAAGEDYIKAAAYVTYNTEIDSAPGNGDGVEDSAEHFSAGGTCAIPSGATFFTLSTHAHKHAIHTQVQDGTPVVFESDNWEEPGTTDWLTNNYQFSAGSLTYQCNYWNDGTARVQEGPSAQTNEMCMAVGYFFPATGPKFCLNSLVVQ